MSQNNEDDLRRNSNGHTHFCRWLNILGLGGQHQARVGHSGDPLRVQWPLQQIHRCVLVVGDANITNFSGCSRSGRAVTQMWLGFIPGESEEGISCELVMCVITYSDRKQKVCIRV